ncbi:DUF4435 domain-containing protein [Leuconostoc citreum]|uniref:Uncharacterized protein n=1 Tax=Leuconostoc citreum (strain KM20) TaxID=349519 RepID=B1MYR8_LEUCK|nr:DUF4435 domain-containing protein [Leuconostoc citreum]ACA82670.1 Hypothetical protein LCK_00840 [Leuconostoc citreum KM20]
MHPDNYVEDMLNKTNNVTTLWTKVQDIINDDSIAVVVEGKDYQYYGYHIRNNNLITKKLLQPVNANGRKNLIRLIDYMIDKEEQIINMLFFLDNELPSQKWENKYCFVTSVNSVESYYVSVNAFAKLIDYHTSITKEYREKLLKKFDDCLQIFNKEMIRIGIFLDTCLQLGLNPIIKKFDFQLFFNFDNLVIHPIEHSLAELLESFVVRCDVNKQKLIKETMVDTQRNIENTDKLSYVRGKYAMSFLRYFLGAVRNSEKKNGIVNETSLSYSLSKDKNNDEVINDWQDISDCDPLLKPYVLKMIS